MAPDHSIEIYLIGMLTMLIIALILALTPPNGHYLNLTSQTVILTKYNIIQHYKKGGDLKRPSKVNKSEHLKKELLKFYRHKKVS